MFLYSSSHVLGKQIIGEMSVSFSSTTLRVPHGFANILEGLTKEVLRDQPEDIPTFAARYFTELLQKREGNVLQ